MEHSDLRGQYRAGNQFIESWRSVAPAGTNHLVVPSLAIGTPGRDLAETMSASLNISFERFRPMIDFAAAVNTLVHNCGDEAHDIIFDPANPQSIKSVKRLSNTSDVRQRYRFNQVLNGDSKTIRLQGSDPVFDTISFAEVPCRLARARGVLIKLADCVDDISDPKIQQELKRLLTIIRDSAVQLEKLVNGKAPTAAVMRRLDKARLFPKLLARAVTGKDVGAGRQALRLTVKNVWGFPEMRRRNLVPADNEKTRVRDELSVIKSTVKRILA